MKVQRHPDSVASIWPSNAWQLHNFIDWQCFSESGSSTGKLLQQWYLWQPSTGGNAHSSDMVREISQAEKSTKQELRQYGILQGYTPGRLNRVQTWKCFKQGRRSILRTHRNRGELLKQSVGPWLWKVSEYAIRNYL